MDTKERAGRNRTIVLNDEEKAILRKSIIYWPFTSEVSLTNKVVCANIFDAIGNIPKASVDLLFVDPPYNLNKRFNNNSFSKMDSEEYATWMDSWFSLLVKMLKNNASVYVCGDWQSSSAIYQVISNYLYIHNRITWEREKGRGALKNWKNASEDIWFGSCSKEYYFNPDAVKLKRRVIAPYRDPDGNPKDWNETANGNFRLTYPSNLWTDLTVPFWSMPENTDHPTQKPEKLVAKIVLASSRPGDLVLDPFLGSGTTAVVAKKTGRNFIGIEIEDEYCCMAQKRLELADIDSSIQGYIDNVFWERNTLNVQKQGNNRANRRKDGGSSRNIQISNKQMQFDMGLAWTGVLSRIFFTDQDTV